MIDLTILDGFLHIWSPDSNSESKPKFRAYAIGQAAYAIGGTADASADASTAQGRFVTRTLGHFARF